MVDLDVASARPEIAVGRIVLDLHASGVSEQEVRQAMDQFLAKADGFIGGSAP